MRYVVFMIAVAGFTAAACSTTPVQPAAPVATVMVDAPAPAGWVTHTSQQCEYSISYPPEMQGTDQTPHSRLFTFKTGTDAEAAPNFIYFSVIPPYVQAMIRLGVYDHSVYNYDPDSANVLMNMQVGESKGVHPSPDVSSGFTYERQPDTTIGGYTARVYVNQQPWEFEAGTKEIRYLVSVDPCTYLFGGYVSTTNPGQAGRLSEEAFQNIMNTIKLMP